ncbi:MAG: hypothetical protein IH626_11345 [Rhodospirillales bacterium]|nr:hypothetical protein [Rhodospirillales bacterium]
MNGVLFDQRDFDLVQMVNAYADRDPAGEQRDRRVRILNFHPNGLRELTSRKAFRVALAVMGLLDTRPTSTPEERLEALRILRAEACSSARSPLRLNTARVLIQLMKELLRARGHLSSQLCLAHDFHKAASGRPRIVRSLLRRLNLLEMPEAWNQRAFDYHVRDSHSSGRKSPTHLIMDAWLKGIRTLKVIYENYAPPAAAQELMDAADIMEVTVRIGIRFHRPFRGQRVTLVWTPRGFSGPKGFREFLEKPAMQALISAGKTVEACERARFARLIDLYNHDYRPVVDSRFGLDVAELDSSEFEALVGDAQPSWAHLADCIHRRTVAAMRARLENAEVPVAAGRAHLEECYEAMERFSPATVLEEWLNEALAATALGKAEAAATFVDEDPPALLKRLAGIATDYRASLDTRDIVPSRVLQLLHLCEGRLTHLELFSLQTYRPEHLPQLSAMNDLREVVNSGSPSRLKRLVSGLLEVLPPEAEEDVGCLRDVVRSMPAFLSHYRKRPLSTFISSNSSGRSDWGGQHGMGFAIIETLPVREQRACFRGGQRRLLPLRYGLIERVRREAGHAVERSAHLARVAPLAWIAYWWLRLTDVFRPAKRGWVAPLESLAVTSRGNVVPLGGFGVFAGNNLGLNGATPGRRIESRWRYVNTVLVNGVLILAGFVSAFLAFQYTQEGFLAYWGAPLWFAVTGSRNILQAVIAGGGLRRYSALTWKDYVSWSRLSESLFYTGFSVPLLEIGVRYLFLQKGLGLTAADSPLAVFLTLAAVNGAYLMSHNLFRGLPSAAAYANLGRSIAAVPVAMAYNYGLFLLLHFLEVGDVAAVLAATTSLVAKTASDTVAAVLEGYFDRRATRRLRARDVRNVLSRLAACHASLEYLFPREDGPEVLGHPDRLIGSDDPQVRQLAEEITIHCLDLMYFHFYQPLSAQTFMRLSKHMSRDEREFILLAQKLVGQEEYVTRLFVDGIFGANFGPALAFYLGQFRTYADFIRKTAGGGGHPAREERTSRQRLADAE